MHRRSAVLAVLVSLTVEVAGQPPQTPVFRGGVDLIHFDVSVLDKDRHPVRGLTAKDFTILEDGKPQDILAFSAVDVPAPVAPPAKWMAEVAPDVLTNEDVANPEGRLFVVLIDDALIPPDLWALKKAREIGHGVIDRVSPRDQVAIVFSSTSESVQSFTQDRSRLHTAVDTTTIGFATYKMGWDTGLRDPRTGQVRAPVIDGDSRLRDASMKTLEMVAETLIAAPQRRKALIFISPGITVDVVSAAMPVSIGDARTGGSMAILEAGRDLVGKMSRLFSEMQKANVTLYPIDPCGLGGLAAYVFDAAQTVPALQGSSASSVAADYNWLAPKGPPPPMALAHHFETVNADFNLAAASNTGGIAVINTNEFNTGLNKIFDENSSYYLLGYRAPAKNAPGSLHRVSVKVNRPDVFVRTRNQYEVPEPDKASKETGATPLRSAMAGPVAVPDLPLNVAVSPVAARDSKDATVMIVLGLQQPAPPTRTPQSIEFQINAFTPDGRPVGAGIKQTATLTLAAGAAGSTARYELLTKLALPHGRYDLRIATRRGSDGIRGSLYTTIDVPNFKDDQLSLSGVWLEATPGVSGVPRDAFASLIRSVPTAVREFGPKDIVTAWFRAYEGGTTPIAPVALRARIVNDHDEVIADATGSLATDRFDPATRSAEHHFTVPISRLAPGEYLLSFEATLGKNVVRRDVRFRIH